MKKFNVHEIRKDFPILSELAYGKPLVYFDNAASSQKPQVVIDALSNYYSQYNSNIHRGVHFLSQKASAAFDEVREKVKSFMFPVIIKSALDSSASSIILLSSLSEIRLRVIIGKYFVDRASISASNSSARIKNQEILKTLALLKLRNTQSLMGQKYKAVFFVR